MRLKIVKVLAAVMSLAVLALIPRATATTSDRLKAQNQALVIISNFVDSICNKIPLEGKKDSLTFSGEGKAKLENILKYLAELGFEGTGKFKTEEYGGVLQSDLLDALKENNLCRLIIWKDLKDKLLPDIINKENSKRQERQKVPDLQVSSWNYEGAIDEKLVNFIVFRLTNVAGSNVKDLTIEVIPGPRPTYPLPRRIDSSLILYASKCETISKKAEYRWKIYCEYIGVDGIVGFSVDTDREDGFPSGEVVITNPDATYKYSF